MAGELAGHPQKVNFTACPDRAITLSHKYKPVVCYEGSHTAVSKPINYTCLITAPSEWWRKS